ncbi:MAG: RNB domain-containing ribonuclease [Propioniciclava sp.]
MPARSLHLPGDIPAPIRSGVARLREDLKIPEAYPAPAVAAAEQGASALVLPDLARTDLPLVTIDPVGATDLDQAVHIERSDGGFRIYYAIADLISFVEPGGPLDAETHRRGVTLYAPHERIPLHPPSLAEDRASLLPGQLRPAVLWIHDLDESGAVQETTVVRACVRSREQLSYADAQRALDEGTASESLSLLREVGELRLAVEAERGGVSLPIPEQEVRTTETGWELRFRAGLPVERWNAQISLLTGMAAADLMLTAGVGILRTLPPIGPAAVARLRRIAGALDVTWDADLDYAGFVGTLDASRPRDAAMLNACTTVFRGAGYAAFAGEPPEQPLHGAMNAAYAHCTAPLRRLVDRYVSQICLSVSAGEPVPTWVLEALDALPGTMAQTTRRAAQYERGIVDLVEALALQGRAGEQFDVSVIEWDDERERGEAQLADPAVLAPLVAAAGAEVRVGTRIRAHLVAVDVAEGKARFEAR